MTMNPMKIESKLIVLPKSQRKTKSKEKRHILDGFTSERNTEYASKKAGGYVKKKGKFEPYAYWHLDRKMLSLRLEHHAVERKGISSVVKLTKKLIWRSAAGALSSRSKSKKAHKKK